MAIIGEINLRLHKSALALVQLKGGAGKTLLVANLAALAARMHDWQVVVVDLDANAPLTGAVFGGYETAGTITQALERVEHQEPVVDLPVFAENLGIYLLKGDIRGIPAAQINLIPRLISALKESHITTPDGTRPVDIVLVDVPGENREINRAVLSGIDYVAMPAMVSAPDIAATSITLQLIASAQGRRGGKPVFLGIIPNRIARRGVIERAFLEVLLKSGKILPYIPSSDVLRGTLVRQSQKGGEGVIDFAPNSKISKRLFRLWEALNGFPGNGITYANEFSEYIGEKDVREKEACDAKE
jgi:cellulose biosynthesis protein BcsQ